MHTYKQSTTKKPPGQGSDSSAYEVHFDSGQGSSVPVMSFADEIHAMMMVSFLNGGPVTNEIAESVTDILKRKLPE